MFGMIEDVDLEIKKDDFDSHWKMQIHLKEFLTSCSLAEFKRLLKYIRESDTPDEEKKILNFVQDSISECDSEVSEWERHTIGLNQKIRFSQKQVDSFLKDRQHTKRNSKEYKEISNHIKRAKEETRILKSRLYAINLDVKKHEKIRAKMEKILPLIK